MSSVICVMGYILKLAFDGEFSSDYHYYDSFMRKENGIWSAWTKKSLNDEEFEEHYYEDSQEWGWNLIREASMVEIPCNGLAATATIKLINIIESFELGNINVVEFRSDLDAPYVKVLTDECLITTEWVVPELHDAVVEDDILTVDDDDDDDEDVADRHGDQRFAMQQHELQYHARWWNRKVSTSRVRKEGKVDFKKIHQEKAKLDQDALVEMIGF